MPVSLTITLAAKPRKIPIYHQHMCELAYSVEQVPTSNDPKLPEHYQSTSDPSRSDLSRENGNSSILCADTNTHDETNSKESLPRLSESGGDRSGGKTAGSKEDFTSTTEVVIKRVDDECTNTAGS